MIELRHLTTGYKRDHPILEDQNVCFDNGKVYAIVGESGCGKTTLLRTIAGLTKPLVGDVIVDGNRYKTATKSPVYMMHQNYTSFDWLKCVDNILISKKIQHQPISKVDIENAMDLLRQVGLEDKAEKYPKQLSGGQKQRLALARTLFTNPRYILMDEPFSALDSDTRQSMQSLVQKHHIATKNTILMVTHSVEEAKLMGDSIITFEEKEMKIHGIFSENRIGRAN